MKVKPVPDDMHRVTPHFIVRGAAEAIEFYKRALGAEEKYRMPGPDGKVMHAELEIGDSLLMISDAFPDWGSPAVPSKVFLYVSDCDAVFARAIEAGAAEVRPLENQFYGDRSGGVRDPWGNVWWIATHVEDVPPDEMERRAREFAAQQEQRAGA